ncbi:Uncharacterised protein [Mycobacteroides abscessus subsp. abscessus]|nr:Uncharacterised protein [Mycobacteroides abscessus subsp. abscessus]
MFRSSRLIDRIIWVRLTPTARWVISTPTGGRVAPDVYCRCETSSSTRCTYSKPSPASSGISSTASTSGASGRPSRNSSTVSRTAAVVSTTMGVQSLSAISSRSA